MKDVDEKCCGKSVSLAQKINLSGSQHLAAVINGHIQGHVVVVVVVIGKTRVEVNEWKQTLNQVEFDRDGALIVVKLFLVLLSWSNHHQRNYS